MNIKQTLRKTVLGAAAVATLGGATLAASSADARPHGWGPGAAVGAGILGLAIGASIASHRDYDRPYYGGYAYGPAYDGYADSCRSYWQWSPRWGRYVRVERCY
jgi:hypothetical protein